MAPTYIFQEEIRLKQKEKQGIIIFFKDDESEPTAFLHSEVLGKSAPKSQVKFSGKHERNQRDPFSLQARGGRKSNDLL